MKTADFDTNMIDSYFNLLKDLSPNSKLELIARLSKSLKTKKVTKDDSWKKLFGALELDTSADEFLADLKNERKFSRKPINL